MSPTPVNDASPVASGLLAGFVAGAAVFIVVASVPTLLINEFMYMFSLPLGRILGISVGVLVGGPLVAELTKSSMQLPKPILTWTSQSERDPFAASSSRRADPAELPDAGHSLRGSVNFTRASAATQSPPQTLERTP